MDLPEAGALDLPVAAAGPPLGARDGLLGEVAARAAPPGSTSGARGGRAAWSSPRRWSRPTRRPRRRRASGCPSTACAAGSTVIGQSSRTTTSCERCRRRPGGPGPVDGEPGPGPPAQRPAGQLLDGQVDVGQPGQPRELLADDGGLEPRAARPASTCCQSQPPQRPGPLYGHGRSTRSGEASRTSTASARQKPGCRSSVTRTTTRSPGSVCRTKTTRPSCRATQWPPCATGPDGHLELGPGPAQARAAGARREPARRGGQRGPQPYGRGRRLVVGEPRRRSPGRARRRRRRRGRPSSPAATARW